MHGARGGAPKGNKNALKHGLYTSEAIGGRRALADLIRRSRRLVEMMRENADNGGGALNEGDRTFLEEEIRGTA
jgi:hypothetical protein